MPGTLEELQGVHCVWKGLCDGGILENKVGGRALAEKEGGALGGLREEGGEPLERTTLDGYNVHADFLAVGTYQPGRSQIEHRVGT